MEALKLLLISADTWLLQMMAKMFPPCLVDYRRRPSPGAGQHPSHEDEWAGLENFKIAWCWDNVDPPWSHTQPETINKALGSKCA